MLSRIIQRRAALSSTASLTKAQNHPAAGHLRSATWLLLTAPAQRGEDQADQQHDAIIAGKGLGGKGAWRNQRGEPEDQYNIKNISANDIADSDVIFAFSRSGDGRGQFGQAGADSDDR